MLLFWLDSVILILFQSDDLSHDGETMLRSLILSLFVVMPLVADEGVLPLGSDGKPLNLDFETGTLKDWTLEGEAFKGQPIKGDTVFPRRNDNKSEHQGQYWIGGFEKLGDKPQGTLTSVPFKVTHPWASFLVAGGTTAETGVEIVRKDTGAVFFRASGLEEENLRRVAVDLKEVQGKEIFVRVVDKHSGHWGHVNFDDFRFHQEKPKITPRPESVAPDDYPFNGLTPDKAAQAMTVPKGFEVKLFAGEPDVYQPIGFCTDDRGRLWVAEAYIYPKRNPAPGALLPEKERSKGDRIVIFEDVDGDGKFDKRTVFLEGLNLVSGIELGFGGVWIGASPYLLFVPFKEGEDKPSREPQILLDGWGYQDTHETLNSFIWGPDGWLYGCHGIFTHSRVGKPGTPDKDRTPIDAGIWRYHPTKHLFEVFAQGTSNPWGLDYNPEGELFVEACVIPHNWHIIQGGRYARQAGSHFNPYTFDDIKTIAEHRHYVGATPHSGNGRSDSVGGGHAHSGTLIYQGGAWPKEYHAQMFMGNIHGHRLNVDQLTPKGSGYVASRSPDFLLTHDKSSLLINMQLAPDGNVYVIDWYDKQSCHRPEPEIWDRTNGRIYKICYQGTKPIQNLDLKKLSDKELLALQQHENEWYVRHSRRILQERNAKLDLPLDAKNETHRLRAMWLAHVLGGLSQENARKCLQDASPHVRAWAIRLITETPPEGNPMLAKFGELAEKDDSPIVRRALASSLQQLPVVKRIPIAEKLLAHAEDNLDHNLPLLYWYAIEPIAEKEPQKALELVMSGKFPELIQFMARRIAMSAEEKETNALVMSILFAEFNKQPEAILPILRGMTEGFKGRRNLKAPESWSTAFPASFRGLDNPEVMQLANSLAVTFGDVRILNRYREILQDPLFALPSRLTALEGLLSAKAKELAPTLQKILKEPALRAPALRALASYDDAGTPSAILGYWKELKNDEKRDALATLASRPAYAKALLAAIGKGEIKANEVSTDLVRIMRNLPDPTVGVEIGKVWGIIRDTPADRAKAIAEWRKKLTPATRQDLSLGRAVFQKTCAQCHTLYGVGSNIGPDITGSNRSNLEYLLENILDPSAVIPNDYKMQTLNLADGRTVLGIVQGEANNILTVVTATEKLLIPKADIERRQPSDKSMMPEDILKPLSEVEIRSLFAYLQAPNQVPMLANTDNAKDFFNGENLKFWDGDPTLWKVEKGEIVGKTDGLKKNNFLVSHFAVENFRLTLKVKLTPNKENSGVQFRSEPLPDGEMRGYQADIGVGWWGKLYEESGRGLLWKEPGDQHVKENEWNDYEVIAEGHKIKTLINGKPCVDLDDPQGALRGIIGLQIHSGGAMEVRFKDLKLEVRK